MAKKVLKSGRKQHVESLSWEGAIAEAEDQIQRARRRIGMLQGAIQVFRERRDAGERWPDNASATTD